MTRVYVPATLGSLAEWVDQGYVPAEADRFVPPGDDEESEYDALVAAADASAELLAGPGRRVVVVAEVRHADAPVAMEQVVAVHADTRDDPDPDDDLGWYATQEIRDLV